MFLIFSERVSLIRHVHTKVEPMRSMLQWCWTLRIDVRFNHYLLVFKRFLRPPSVYLDLERIFNQVFFSLITNTGSDIRPHHMCFSGVFSHSTSCENLSRQQRHVHSWWSTCPWSTSSGLGKLWCWCLYRLVLTAICLAGGNTLFFR